MQEIDSGRSSSLVIAVELATASLTVLVRIPYRKYRRLIKSQCCTVLRMQEHARLFSLRRPSRRNHLEVIKAYNHLAIRDSSYDHSNAKVQNFELS